MVHLLTVEALEDQMTRVAPGGVIAAHISNRYLDLEPVLAGQSGLTALSARAKVVPSADRRGDWYVRRLSKQVATGDTLA